MCQPRSLAAHVSISSVNFTAQCAVGRDWGWGDVKLIMAAGAWTGIIGVSYVVLLASVGALAYVGLISVIGGRKVVASTAIPFGVFLAPSIWVVWVFLQSTGGMYFLF